MKLVLMEKNYTDESLVDAEEDIGWAVNSALSLDPKGFEIPTDEHGFRKGTFKITVEWTDE